jgi:GDP-4-dehydro-6-deoxy-D-mannose reductase
MWTAPLTPADVGRTDEWAELVERTMRVLITGGSGFLGAHLVERLRAEQPSALVSIDAAPRGGSRMVDVRDPHAVGIALEDARPDVIFHLAGVLKSTGPEALYDVNATGTAVLLEAVLRADQRPRVVMASSSAVYGDCGPEAVDETRALRPLTHYGASKAAQEIVARRAVDADGLDLVVLRMFNLVGPGQPDTLAPGAFARQVAECERRGGGEIAVGSLAGLRDYVDVRDAADAFVLAALKGGRGATFNVCSGTGTRMRDCLDILVGAARVRPRVVERPPEAADAAAQVGSARRIRSELGWSPRIALDRSLCDLLDDWRTQIAKRES